MYKQIRFHGFVVKGRPSYYYYYCVHCGSSVQRLKYFEKVTTVMINSFDNNCPRSKTQKKYIYLVL